MVWVLHGAREGKDLGEQRLWASWVPAAAFEAGQWVAAPFSWPQGPCPQPRQGHHARGQYGRRESMSTFDSRTVFEEIARLHGGELAGNPHVRRKPWRPNGALPVTDLAFREKEAPSWPPRQGLRGGPPVICQGREDECHEERKDRPGWRWSEVWCRAWPPPWGVKDLGCVSGWADVLRAPSLPAFSAATVTQRLRSFDLRDFFGHLSCSAERKDLECEGAPGGGAPSDAAGAGDGGVLWWASGCLCGRGGGSQSPETSASHARSSARPTSGSPRMGLHDLLDPASLLSKIPRPGRLLDLDYRDLLTYLPVLTIKGRLKTLRMYMTDKIFRLAERRKDEGNEQYKAKEYREALKLYTQAIELCPDCAAYYSNRSACYMMLGKYNEALNDAREAVRLDKNFVKGYVRVAKCNIALGDANAALSVLRQAGELEPNNKAIRDEINNAQALIRCNDEIEKATTKGDYRTAIFHLDRALDLAVGCRSLKITKGEYLVFLQRYADAQEIVNEILQYDSGNADAIYVRGMCLYYQDNAEAAFNHFQHVLRLAPDHQKAREIYKKAKQLKLKKEEGNEAFKRGNFQEAFTLYTEALAIDPLNKHTNAKLYFNRATVGSKLNKLEEAIEDCTAAINLDEGYIKAYLRRAKCYQSLEKHEEAVRDYEKVAKLDRSQEHKRLLHEAKIQLKRSKRKDYYKILGVNKNASDDEIKKSYRKMALVHHPDRHANATDKDKREHEIKFKEIGEAYSVLTDAKKRALYDRGHDVNDPDGGFGHDADIDPNQIFQAFFGGGHGGFSFGGQHAGFQQGGGFPGGGFNSGSFPGGFHFQFG